MAKFCLDDKRFDSSKSYWGAISILLGLTSIALALYSIKQTKAIRPTFEEGA